jgi:hypothetical protein
MTNGLFVVVIVWLLFERYFMSLILNDTESDEEFKAFGGNDVGAIASWTTSLY